MSVQEASVIPDSLEFLELHVASQKASRYAQGTSDDEPTACLSIPREHRFNS